MLAIAVMSLDSETCIIIVLPLFLQSRTTRLYKQLFCTFVSLSVDLSIRLSITKSLEMHFFAFFIFLNIGGDTGWWRLTSEVILII